MLAKTLASRKSWIIWARTRLSREAASRSGGLTSGSFCIERTSHSKSDRNHAREIALIMPAIARSGLFYAPIDRDRRAIVQAFLHGLGDLPLNIAIVLPVTAWLACFTALNILVKALSFTVSTGGLFERALAMAKSPTLYV